MSPLVSRRSVTAADDDFLFALFKAVRAHDLALVPMAPAQLDLLMRMQYTGQMESYAAQYPDSDHDLILLDGCPIGRIWVALTRTRHVLVDIALLPANQNQGIGEGLVTPLITHAAQAGVPLCCSVAAANSGSLRFHQRLGFEIVAQDELYYRLERKPGVNSGADRFPATR